jgi:hypothetical protein
MEQNKQPEPLVIGGQKATQEEVSWLAFALKESQETPKRVEDAAKYLSGLIAVTFTIFLQPREKAFAASLAHPLFGWAVGLWLVAVVLSLGVVFPLPYAYLPNSAGSIKAAYRRVTVLKLSILVAGTVCFLAALAMLAYLYFQPVQ